MPFIQMHTQRHIVVAATYGKYIGVHTEITCTHTQSLPLIIQEHDMPFFLFNVKYLVKVIIIACLQCERPYAKTLKIK